MASFTIADIGELVNISFVNMSTYSGGKLPYASGQFSSLNFTTIYVWDRWRSLEYQFAIVSPRNFNMTYTRNTPSYNLRVVSNLLFCCFLLINLTWVEFLY